MLKCDLPHLQGVARAWEGVKEAQVIIATALWRGRRFVVEDGKLWLKGADPATDADLLEAARRHKPRLYYALIYHEIVGRFPRSCFDWHIDAAHAALAGTLGEVERLTDGRSQAECEAAVDAVRRWHDEVRRALRRRNVQALLAALDGMLGEVRASLKAVANA